MATCLHPASAQFFDRVRGQTSCTQCGEVLSDQQFELDPAFARGERGAGGGGAGGMRAPGFARPNRPQNMHGSHGLARPSMEAARRSLTAIARKLSIPPAQVDIATGLFKMAVSSHAVIGARSAVLSACLYIVCRRQQDSTPLTVLDFADTTGDSPFSIVDYMRTICKATNTTLPPLDPVFLVARLVSNLDLGPQKEDIAVYAMKVMRAMKADWISTGRRPLGVAAAALLVACQVHGVELSVESLAKLVRLNQFTLLTRIEEFAATPAASLSTIDDFDVTKAGQTTAPVAFTRGRKNDDDYVLADDLRALSTLFYELVNEAKLKQAATPERIDKWRLFMKAKAQSSGEQEEALPMDLRQLTHQQQLELLGAVSRRFKIEQSVKPEPLRTQEETALLESSVQRARALAASDSFQPIVAAATEAEAAEEERQKLSAAAASAPSSASPALAAQQQPPQASASSSTLHAATTALGEELALSDSSDVEDEYVIYDNEARIRNEKANRAAFRDEWDNVGARVAAAIAGTTGGVVGARAGGRVTLSGTKRERPPAAASALDNVRRALAQRGGGNIDIDRLEDILPGIGAIDDIGSNVDIESLSGGLAGNGRPAMGAASEGDVTLSGLGGDEWVLE
jgi:transcription factor IIIB subunit 2